MTLGFVPLQGTLWSVPRLVESGEQAGDEVTGLDFGLVWEAALRLNLNHTAQPLPRLVIINEGPYVWSAADPAAPHFQSTVIFVDGLSVIGLVLVDGRFKSGLDILP